MRNKELKMKLGELQEKYQKHFCQLVQCSYRYIVENI